MTEIGRLVERLKKAYVSEFCNRCGHIGAEGSHGKPVPGQTWKSPCGYEAPATLSITTKDRDRILAHIEGLEWDLREAVESIRCEQPKGRPCLIDELPCNSCRTEEVIRSRHPELSSQ